jgi:hypothetical protein
MIIGMIKAHPTQNRVAKQANRDTTAVEAEVQPQLTDGSGGSWRDVTAADDRHGVLLGRAVKEQPKRAGGRRPTSTR